MKKSHIVLICISGFILVFVLLFVISDIEFITFKPANNVADEDKYIEVSMMKKI